MDCVSKCGCRLEGGRRRQVVRKHRESELREDMVEDGEARHRNADVSVLVRRLACKARSLV